MRRLKNPLRRGRSAAFAPRGTSAVVASALVVAAGCGFLREVSPAEQRAHCDNLARQAAEAESLDEARILATRAAECYEDLQAQRR